MEIQTKRLLLKSICHLTEEQLDDLSELNADEDVRAFFPEGIQNRKQTKIRIEKLIKYYHEYGTPCFLIYDKKTNEFIGRSGFAPFKNVIEVGYLIRKKYWGIGIATEALYSMLKWSKKNLAQKPIIGFAPKDHLASQNVMKKCGMQFYKEDDVHETICKFYIFYNLNIGCVRSFENNVFKQNILSIYSESGKVWLDHLPDYILKTAKKYNLIHLKPVNNMSFNYIVRGYQHDKVIILKMGLDYNLLEKEKIFLNIVKSISPEIIAHEPGMILMTCVTPGITLKTYFPNRDTEATEVLCSIIKLLHETMIPEQHPFIHIRDLLKILDQNFNIPDEILFKARMLRDNLINSTEKEVLLHGDLHHDNILKNNESEWLIIDPKGFIGDPAFEFAAYLCNPTPELLQSMHSKEIIKNRIKLCAKQFEIPVQRIKDWLYVKSVLCWAWCLDDNLDPSYFKYFLERI